MPSSLAVAAEADGNPVIGLVALLRERSAGQTARWLHRGLTSQDVIDTALMLCLRDALSRIRGDLTTQVRTLVGLAETHHRSPMLARTLTQPALPSTVGAKVANWLSGVLDAVDTLAAVPALPVQMGGAAGTLAATTELTGSPVEALALSDALATALGLQGRRAMAHHALGDHACRRRAGWRAATPGAISPPTSRWAAGAKSVNWPRAAAAARRRCRTRATPCCRC